MSCSYLEAFRLSPWRTLLIALSAHFSTFFSLKLHFFFHFYSPRIPDKRYFSFTEEPLSMSSQPWWPGAARCSRSTWFRSSHLSPPLPWGAQPPSLCVGCFITAVALCLLCKSSRLRTQSDLKGNAYTLSITVLTILCLCKDVEMFSTPTGPELPFFMVNRLSALPWNLPSCSRSIVENSVEKAFQAADTLSTRKVPNSGEEGLMETYWNNCPFMMGT